MIHKLHTPSVHPVKKNKSLKTLKHETILVKKL